MSTSASEDPDYELNAAWEISPLPFPDRFVPPPRPDPLPSHHTGVAGPSAVQHTQGDDFELNPLWEQHPAKEPIPSHYHPGPPSSHPIVVAGPSGTQQIQKTERPPLIVTGHSNDLLIDTDTSDVDYGTSGTNTQGRFPGSSNFPAQQQHIIPKPTLQERSSDIPMIHEEDEDYNDYNHPSGFRRANEADLSERAGNPPDGIFTLPSRRHKEFDTRFFGQRNNNVLHIARKTGTHISMPLDMDNEPVMQMWGTPERLQNARHDLHALLEEVQQEIDMTERRVGGPWAKTRAMPTDRRQEILDKLILDAKIRKLYRLPPPDGSRFPAVGVFVWPTDGPNPQKAFGVTLEALDDIRFEHRVYILYVRKGNILRALGDDSKSVEIAIGRIFGAFCEVATKNRLTTKMTLVQPPSIDLPATRVYSKQDHDLVGRQVTVTRIQENKGIQLFLSGPPPGYKFLSDWKTDRESLNKANVEYLRKALGQGLQDVAYYRGHTRLRVYIGRMVLFGYKRAKNGIYQFKDFNDMAHDPRTNGEVVRSIGSGRGGVDDKETAEELINNCNNCPDIFQSVDTNPDVSGLNGPSMEPLICATFDIRLNGDGGRTKDIRLEVVFERLPGKKIYRPLHRRWLDTAAVNRKGQGLNRRNGPLDVKVIDLEADLAYQFEIATWQLYKDTECYPIFQEFVRRITVEEIPDESHPSGAPAPNQPDTRPTVRRISYMNIPSLSVIGLIQKTKWRYWMGNTNYIFELVRYELFSVHEVSALFPEGVPVSFRGVGTLPDTRWGCAVWNTDWDHKLSQQAVAEIGNRGNWEPDVDKFFESSGGLDNCLDDDGFEELLGKIREGLDIVSRARASAIRKKQEGAEKWPAMSFADGPWTGTAEFDN